MKHSLALAKRNITLLSFAVFGLCSVVITNPACAQISVGIEIAPPVWAPHYERPNEVQYYYLPDIEAYYDVWHHEFVYQEGGNWVFAAALPGSYAGYDLYNGHVVVLDRGVHEPWRFHHLYVSHYPRYYYHSAFRPTPAYPNHPRAFDENGGRPIYEPRNDAHPVVSPRAPEGRSQPVVYTGRSVGQPVRVTRGMRRPR